MGSRPCINMSLLLIIASMAMLASSDTIQPETAYDLPTCVEALKGCLYEIHQFKMGLLNGVLPQPGSGFIGPACCEAILDIHQKCWLFMLPDPFFTPQLQNYCTRQSQMAPPPGYPLAPAPATDPETPSPAPEIDPPAPAPHAPAPAPKDVDPPAPAPHAPAPAPKVDPPAPAPRTPLPDPPAPAPHRHCRRRRGHHGPGGNLSEKWFCT